MRQRPAQHAARQVGVLLETAEARERDEELPGAMDVDGPAVVVVVLGAAVGLEEMVDVEPEAALDGVVVRAVARGLFVGGQGVEVVARVEAVDPPLHGQQAVHPRAVRGLPLAAGLHRTAGRREAIVRSAVAVAQGQQLAAQQRGVVDRVVARQRTVREQETARRRRAVQVVEHEARRRHGRLAVGLAPRQVVGVEQGRGAKARGHHRGRALGEEEEAARLPVEVVAPAAARVARRAQREQQLRQLVDAAGECFGRAQLSRQLRPALHGAQQVAVAAEKEPDALGVILLGHERQPAQVHGAALEALDDHEAAQRRPFQQRQRLEEPRVEPVVRVPAAEALPLAIAAQAGERRKKFLHGEGKNVSLYQWLVFQCRRRCDSVRAWPVRQPQRRCPVRVCLRRHWLLQWRSRPHGCLRTRWSLCRCVHGCILWERPGIWNYPPYCNLLSDRYIVANLCFRMEDDAHAAIAESRALADMGLVRDLAIVDEEDEQRDELREKRHVVQIEPACDTVKVNGVEHEMQINC